MLGDAIIPECYRKYGYHGNSKQEIVHNKKKNSLPEAPGVHRNRTWMSTLRSYRSYR